MKLYVYIFVVFCFFNTTIFFTQCYAAPNDPTGLKVANELSPTFYANSITSRLITWYFDKEYQCGQFTNGDYFVVSPTGIKIRQITPQSIQGAGNNVINGSMVNPNPQVKQQGFNQNIPDITYNSVLNVAYGVDSANPLNVTTDSSLISTISKNYSTDNHSYIKSAEILTVLSRIPPSESFRPPYVGSDKTIVHIKSELNYNLLLSLSPVSNTPGLSTVEDLFARPWLEFNTSPNCSSMHPSDNMKWYGRDIAADIGVGALTLNLNYTNAQKENLLIYFTQLGLDYYGIVQNGGSWEANGGHEGGRKYPILFAAIALNDSTMQSMFSKTGDYLYENGFYEGNRPPDLIEFGEDGQTFYVTQRDVNRQHNREYDWDIRNSYVYPMEGIDYISEDIGLPEWGIWHSGSPLQDSKDWNTNYRNTAGTCWSGIALSVLMMESVRPVRTIWNHDAFFDYVYRFMGLNSANNTFTQNMWDRYIGAYYLGPYGP